eukprot:6198485-Pleurochrysis_carterae.AAC.3
MPLRGAGVGRRSSERMRASALSSPSRGLKASCTSPMRACAEEEQGTQARVEGGKPAGAELSHFKCVSETQP